MGYVHTIGVARELNKHLAAGNTLGRLYVLAPENACSSQNNLLDFVSEQDLDYKDFEEIWQYGADETSPTKFKVYELDGVAPQCAIPGLGFGGAEDNEEGVEAYGRIPFTDLKDWEEKRNFVDIHLGENYDWIVSEIENGLRGYVKKRD